MPWHLHAHLQEHPCACDARHAKVAEGSYVLVAAAHHLTMWACSASISRCHRLLCCSMSSTSPNTMRLPPSLLLLQVTYFYRLPELADAVKDSSSNMCSLTHALQSLAITDTPKEANALPRKGCRTPSDYMGMQCVGVTAALSSWSPECNSAIRLCLCRVLWIGRGSCASCW
jgi:hypothetical protein